MAIAISRVWLTGCGLCPVRAEPDAPIKVSIRT